MISIRQIEHAAISARDTDALADFYVNALGFRRVFTNGKSPATWFVAPPAGAMIEIMPANGAPAALRDNQDPGLAHLALLTDDLDSAMAELADRHGVRFEGDVKVSGGAKAAFFRDPEGNLLHLLQRDEPL